VGERENRGATVALCLRVLPRVKNIGLLCDKIRSWTAKARRSAAALNASRLENYGLGKGIAVNAKNTKGLDMRRVVVTRWGIGKRPLAGG